MDRSKYTIISLLVAIQVLLAGRYRFEDSNSRSDFRYFFRSQKLINFHLGSKVDACRVGSEKLTNYVTSRIERLLEPTTLSLLYWNDEPLDAK